MDLSIRIPGIPAFFVLVIARTGFVPNPGVSGVGSDAEYKMTPSSTRLATFLLVFLCLLVPAVARAQVIEGHHTFVFFLGGIPASDALIDLEVTVHPAGCALASAAITPFGDGASNTFMIGEAPPHVSRGDVGGDGFAGVTGVLVTLAEARSRNVMQLMIVPEDGEIDSEIEQMTIIVGNGAFSQIAEDQKRGHDSLGGREQALGRDQASLTSGPRRERR